MNFLQQLKQKPWAAEQGAVDDLHEGGEFSLPIPQFGLRVFLGVATVVFTLFIVVYLARMELPDWRSLHEPWVLWVNTVVLILSSVAFQWAWISADRGQVDGVKTGLFWAGGFALAFLAGQFWAWQQLVELGYYASTNPANAFFYLLTAMHALHLFGGLVAWGRTTARVWNGFGAEEVCESVELCAVYWHFLLVVWLVLFGLLLFT